MEYRVATCAYKERTLLFQMCLCIYRCMPTTSTCTLYYAVSERRQEVSSHGSTRERRVQEPGYAGKASLRDPQTSNRRKRKYGKRPVKAPNAPGGAAAASMAAKEAREAGLDAEDRKAKDAAAEAAAAAIAGSAMSQRRKFIMHLGEARSIGKRPAPQFTNYLYFKTQSARVQPMERLPRKEVVQAGRQAGRVAVIGMMYPRLTTSSEAVARLALAPLKWRGLLENCVSAGQVRQLPLP